MIAIGMDVREPNCYRAATTVGLGDVDRDRFPGIGIIRCALGGGSVLLSNPPELKRPGPCGVRARVPSENPFVRSGRGHPVPSQQ